MSGTKLNEVGLQSRSEGHDRRLDEHDTRFELLEARVESQERRIVQFDKAWLKGERHGQLLMKKVDELLRLMRRKSDD